jgi:hypothetical protein
MAMATSTFSPRPASRAGPLKPLQAGAKPHLLLSSPRLRAGRLARAATGEAPPKSAEPSLAASNGSAARAEAPARAVEAAAPLPRFRDARWVNGTWDLSQFEKAGVVDWDAVIDAGETATYLFLSTTTTTSLYCIAAASG